jgi:hypothetical protein
MEPESEEYDYAVVGVPFSKVRLWNLPKYSSLLSRAISSMNYQQSCKVSLHYKTRFWEKLSPPIIGGCGAVDIPGIGSVCYPAYKINSTGPGVILGSYASGTLARSLAALSTEDHVAYVQRAMVVNVGKLMSTRRVLGRHLQSDSKNCTCRRTMRPRCLQFSLESTRVTRTPGSLVPLTQRCAARHSCCWTWA